MGEVTTREREARGDAYARRRGSDVEADDAFQDGPGEGMDPFVVVNDVDDGVVLASPEAVGPAPRPLPYFALFDRVEIDRALDEYADDDEFLGPEDERVKPLASERGSEHVAWVGTLRRVRSMDPRRRELVGTMAMVEALDAATATLPHFSQVTRVVRQAVESSAITGMALRFPPILAVSEPGVGKTYYARAIAGALGTLCVATAMNATSDRGVLGGSSMAWKGARVGRLAKSLLFDSANASPLFFLDEVDKASNLYGENVAQVLLSALEPENASRFVDEYLTFPVALDRANWFLTANDERMIPEPVLHRMLPVTVRRPTRDESRVIVASVAATVMRERAGGLLDAPADDALDALAHVPARKARQALELAVADAICARSGRVEADGVVRALALVERRTSAYGFVG